MSVVYFKDDSEIEHEVQLNKSESVLDGLLRVGHKVPHSCKSGVCQSCIMTAKSSVIPKDSQRGLRNSQKQQGHFLSCCCVPQKPLVISLTGQYIREECTVLNKAFIAPDVVRLRINKVIDYRSGQYVTLWKDNETARSYSIASHPGQDDFIEFHIRIYPDGVFSSWLVDELVVGARLAVQGPIGNCFYALEDNLKPIFLSGLGTGLAPLYGIARDALLSGHKGEVLVLVGAKLESGLYYQEEFADLQRLYPQLKVHYSVQKITPGVATTNHYETDIYNTAKTLIPSFAGVSVFLCGNVSFVKKMRKQCFLSGANMADIYSDSFLSFS